MKINLALFGAMVVLPAFHAGAALVPLYEPFDYDPGTVTKLDNQAPDADHVWYQAGATNATGVPRPTAGSLAMPAGMPPASGNHAIYGGASSEGARIGVVSFDENGVGQGVLSGTVYFSLAIKVTDTGNITGQTGAIGQIITGFNNTPADSTTNPTALGAAIWVQPGSSPDTYRLGFSSTSNTFDRTFESGEHALGDTLFVVGSLNLVSGAKNDVTNLWINPTTLGADEASLPPADFSKTNTTSGGNDLSNISTFLLFRPGGTNNQPGTDGIEIDELRVDSTYAAVTTPEPGALSLVALSGGMSLLRRKRRTR